MARRTLNGRMQKKRMRDLIGMGLVSLSLFILGYVFYDSYTAPDRPRYTADNCRLKQVEKGLWLIIVDHTDHFGRTDAQKRFVQDRIARTIEATIKRVKEGERVTFFEFGKDVQEERGSLSRIPELVTRCHSGTWDDVDQNRNNKKKVEEQLEQRFFKPLRDKFPDMLRSEEYKISPIIEVLFDIATRDENKQTLGAKHIVLVSDMKQNSDDLRFYDKGSLGSDAALITGFDKISGGRNKDLQGFELEAWQLFAGEDRSVATQVEKAWRVMLRLDASEPVIKRLTWKQL